MFSDKQQSQRDFEWLRQAPQLLKLPARLQVPDLFWVEAMKCPQGLEYDGGHRIGFYYQWLLKHALLSHPSYQLIAEEIQLNADGKTLGSVDFLVKSDTGELEHWEVAVKFYLAYDKQWFGPNAKDTLAKKQEKMVDHQLALSTTTVFQQQFPDLVPTQHKLLMQGRLYINPWLEETHISHEIARNEAIQGYWCWNHQLPDNAVYSLLSRGQWMCSPDPETLPTIEGNQIKPVQRAQHLIDEQGKHWFVVPDNWPDS
ncbi:DUF1853 family protein [Veronia pacifica]|uniref:Type II citrate synthase n=1 Tax=Veronia pacifica TaxID=1080227 RepID=A0A1C3ERH7_9GAMM|nr:DUF1853 family protein [Veronia pacifica]ODA35824.1 hypothetical protein A8L45_01960 [Veronia pacifica]